MCLRYSAHGPRVLGVYRPGPILRDHEIRRIFHAADRAMIENHSCGGDHTRNAKACLHLNWFSTKRLLHCKYFRRRQISQPSTIFQKARNLNGSLFVHLRFLDNSCGGTLGWLFLKKNSFRWEIIVGNEFWVHKWLMSL